MNYSFYIDFKRCSGCYACAVACMDQNDLNLQGGDRPYRKVYKYEKGNYPEEQITFMTFACMHCQDAPCRIGCPTGAIKRDDATDAIYVVQSLCIGCHSCALACPFGIPRFDLEGKMQKCHSCYARLQYGKEPACVQVCPTKALTYGSINEIAERTAAKVSKKLLSQL